jgi:hypothetical protein
MVEFNDDHDRCNIYKSTVVVAERLAVISCLYIKNDWFGRTFNKNSPLASRSTYRSAVTSVASLQCNASLQWNASFVQDRGSQRFPNELCIALAIGLRHSLRDKRERFVQLGHLFRVS